MKIHFFVKTNKGLVCPSESEDFGGGGFYIPVINGKILPSYRFDYSIYLGNGLFDESELIGTANVVENNCLALDFDTIKVIENPVLKISKKIIPYVGKRHESCATQYSEVIPIKLTIFDDILENFKISIIGCKKTGEQQC